MIETNENCFISSSFLVRMEFSVDNTQKYKIQRILKPSFCQTREVSIHWRWLELLWMWAFHSLLFVECFVISFRSIPFHFIRSFILFDQAFARLYERTGNYHFIAALCACDVHILIH